MCASTSNNASCRPRKLGTAATCRHGTHPNLETRSRETSTRFALCTTNKFARWSIFEKFPWKQIFPDEELLEPTLTESAHPRPLTRAPRLASPMAHMSPHPTNIRRPGTRAWEVGLCCPSGMDCGLCASATFCPCFVIGANAKMLKTGYITGPCCDDGGFGTNPCVYSGSLACLQGVAQTFISSALGTSATWFQLLPFYSCHWRKAVREKLDIDGHPCTDFACHYFCMPCSLCQEHVSLKREIFHAQMMAQQSGGQPAYVGYGHGGQVALQPQPAYYGQQGPVATGYPVAQGNPYSNPGGNPYANTQAYPPPAHRMS